MSIVDITLWGISGESLAGFWESARRLAAIR
jgi:hypothetical protein